MTVRHNNALELFVTLFLKRTPGCAGRRLACRYAAGLTYYITYIY
jgi:hypothetical protein